MIATLLRGITPAYAGKSYEKRLFLSGSWDHPRVCGEKICEGLGCRGALGSPPRMRGKVEIHCCRVFDVGITPAYAGKSHRILRRGHADKDHPRVCGEKRRPTIWTRPAAGSPPRMRGKGGKLPCRVCTQGITPAYAGKRLKRSHSISHFSCILCLFHSVLHRASVSGGSRAGPCAPPCLPAQNTVPV